jgi:hypothetical protein
MPNVFTALQPTLFSAAQEVSNEPFGIISAIAADFDDKGVAIGDNVVVPIAPTAAVATFTPAMTPTAGTDKTASSVSVTITANKQTSWNMTGEQIKSLENANSDKEWVRQLVAQGMRSLRNAAEVDALTAIRTGASRATGTAATQPFTTAMDGIVDVRKILHDNGAPLADLQLVFDTTGGAALRKLGIIQQAYQAGSDAERRSGELMRQYGFQLRESAAIGVVTKGTGASYTSDTTGYAIGTTSIPLITGTGTVLAGDVVTFTGDTNKYVVNTGVAAPGTIVAGRPGLKKALAASAVAMTVGGDFTPYLAFERSAVVGVMRPPVYPDNPTVSKTLISDSKGMTYLLVQIAGYGMLTWELHLAWGFKVVQSEHVALLLA